MKFSSKIKTTLFIFALSLTVYSFFQFPGFQGYEDETYNQIIKNIKTGELKTSRSGYVQTVLETPFVLKGKIVGDILGVSSDKIMQLYALFYNPFVTAVSAGVMFLLFNLFVLRKKAFFLSLIYAFATMAFPYAAIGMEPTAVLFVLLSVYFLFIFGRNIIYYVPTNVNIYLFLSGLFYFLLFFSKAYYFVTVLAFLSYIYFYSRRLTPPVQPIAIGGTTSSPIKSGTGSQMRGGKVQSFSPSDEGEMKEGVDFKRFIKLCTIFFSPLILILPVYLLANKYNFGNYLGGQYNLSNELTGGENIIFGTYGLLLSFGKSLFIYVPVLVLSVIFFRRFYGKFKKEAIFVAVYALCLILFVAQIHWWSDETWGPRYLLSLSAIGLLPLVVLFSPVIPAPHQSAGQAPAGIQRNSFWIPAFAGMTTAGKIKTVTVVFVLIFSFLIQLLGATVRYDVFPYSFYEIFGKTGYNVLASQEYQYVPQFAPYLVNYQVLKNRLLNTNKPLKYNIIYTPPMEMAAKERGREVVKELEVDNTKYKNHALNFWWKNEEKVSAKILFSLYLLLFLGLALWGRKVLKYKQEK